METKYDYNYENYKLILVWKNPLTYERIPIGKLWKDRKTFKFKYIEKNDSEEGNVQLAIDQGFVPFGPLSDLSKEYTSEKMFDIFLSRLPVDMRNQNTFKSLKKTGGKLVIDNLEFMHQSDLKSKETKIEVKISGFEYIVTDDILDDLFKNQKIVLEFDKDNPHDPNAIKVMLEKSKIKLGYIPEKYKDYIDKLVDDKSYYAIIKEVENDELIVSVSGEMIGLTSDDIDDSGKFSDMIMKFDDDNLNVCNEEYNFEDEDNYNFNLEAA